MNYSYKGSLSIHDAKGTKGVMVDGTESIPFREWRSILEIIQSNRIDEDLWSKERAERFYLPKEYMS